MDQLDHLQLQDIVDVAPDRKTAGALCYLMQASSHDARPGVAGMPYPDDPGSPDALVAEPKPVQRPAESTISDPHAQRWLPRIVAALKQIKEQNDPAAGLERCAQMCLELASGRYDALSGRYRTPEDDFVALLQRCARSALSLLPG